jgi:hypothetical protein
VAVTPEKYACFVRASKAELCVAKSGYVSSNSGWFSDRSVCYLASGRPVIAQDTGCGGSVPAGAGLLLFDSAVEAATAVESVESDWAGHRLAARELAEEYFSARRVLPRLLDQLSSQP